MRRQCRITDCTTPARPGRHLCTRHKYRLARYGDPHFHTWHVADEHNVAVIVHDRRPARGLTRLERVQVARGLTAHGLPAHEIARILAVTPRTVYRWRAQGFRPAA